MHTNPSPHLGHAQLVMHSLILDLHISFQTSCPRNRQSEYSSKDVPACLGKAARNQKEASAAGRRKELSLTFMKQAPWKRTLIPHCHHRSMKETIVRGMNGDLGSAGNKMFYVTIKHSYSPSNFL